LSFDNIWIYEAADPFSEGLASVLVKGKWGYINKEGKMQVNPRYFASGVFSNGLAPVEIDK
jgi:hypothetical protein